MKDYAAARKNMVDCQIHTNGIINPDILDAFTTIPREIFVPEHMKDVAYCDEDIRISKDRYLIEPITHARMVQAIEPKSTDVALDIGGGTGYSAAILSSLVSTVMAVEEDKTLLQHATQTWDSLDIRNIVPFNQTHMAGNIENAPYDLIFINGSVADIPPDLTEQLTPEGRMITILKNTSDHMGQVIIIQKNPSGGFSKYPLFEASCPYLKGFEPKPAFTF